VHGIAIHEMDKNKFILAFALIFLASAFSLVSAEEEMSESVFIGIYNYVSNLWTSWFGEEIIDSIDFKLKEINISQQWVVIKSTDAESQLTFWKQSNGKKTELGWIPPNNNCAGWGEKYIYDGNNNFILDDKAKTIKLKCESAKCDGQNCYHISLTDAQAVNINDYIKLGEHSIIVVYQDINILNYNIDFAEANITLYKKVNNEWINNVPDLFVFYNDGTYKFGANDSNNEYLENYKYVLESDSPIIQDGLTVYIKNPEQKYTGGLNGYYYKDAHTFDLQDICNRRFECHNELDEFEETYEVCNVSAGCSFDYSEIIVGTKEIEICDGEINCRNEEINIYHYLLGVEFISDKDIDPTITILNSEITSNSILNNVTAETGASNFTHLNISNEAPYDALVGYWSADGDKADTKLTTAYDLSGRGQHGTMLNDAIATDSAGKYGKGYQFDGNDNITVTQTSALRTANKTVMGWIKVNSFDVQGLPIAHFNHYSSTTYNSIRTEINGKFSVAYRAGGSNQIITSSSTFSTGIWHHVAFSYSSGEPYFYVNGILEASGTRTGDLASSTADMEIGKFFNGSVDEVMIFNQPLTQAQILAIYNNQSARFMNTGTQDLINQTYLNISTGNNRVNISTTFDSLMNSKVNLTLGYYDGSWHSTNSQTLTSGVNSTFEISPTSTNLTLNYTLIAGDYQFYTPLIYGDIEYEAWNEGGGIPDTSFTVSLPMGYTQLNFSSNSKTISNLNAEGQNSETGVLYITNTGTVGLDIYLLINQTIDGFSVFAKTDNNPSGAIVLSDSALLLKDNLGTSSSQYIWIWTNWTNQAPNTIVRKLNASVTEN
jgi:hypothetical protein